MKHVIYPICIASLFVVVGVMGSGCEPKGSEDDLAAAVYTPPANPAESRAPTEAEVLHDLNLLNSIKEHFAGVAPPEPPMRPEASEPKPASDVPLEVAVKDFKRAIHRVVSTAEKLGKGGK